MAANGEAGDFRLVPAAVASSGKITKAQFMLD
jgi:hypothetical protein